MDELIRSTDKRGVHTLRMNRPAVHNAFDAALIRELTLALCAAEQDDAVKVVVITGTGACFSAGADINWMRAQADASQDDNERDALELAALMRTLNFLAKPSMAVVNGSAFGGGLGLIATCDISIAVDNARFGLTEVRLGLVPAVISPYVFRRLGEANARRYFLTGERFDSATAQALGLIQQCVSPEQLEQSAEEVISQLLKAGPRAMVEAKQLLFEISGQNVDSQLAIDKQTSKLIARLRVSSEGQEGLAAFLEKRKPVWLDPQ